MTEQNDPTREALGAVGTGIAWVGVVLAMATSGVWAYAETAGWDRDLAPFGYWGIIWGLILSIGGFALVAWSRGT